MHEFYLRTVAKKYFRFCGKVELYFCPENCMIEFVPKLIITISNADVRKNIGFLMLCIYNVHAKCQTEICHGSIYCKCSFRRRCLFQGLTLYNFYDLNKKLIHFSIILKVIQL